MTTKKIQKNDPPTREDVCDLFKVLSSKQEEILVAINHLRLASNSQVLALEKIVRVLEETQTAISQKISSQDQKLQDFTSRIDNNFSLLSQKESRKWWKFWL